VRRLGHALVCAVIVLCAGAPVSAQQSCSRSLQSLVDSAAAGATVNVPPCTYHETLTIGKAITLDGRNQATITGDNVRDRWAWIAASNVTIRNFRMLDANSALEEGALATAAGVSNIVIDHNDLGPTRNGDPIAIGGTTNSKILNNQIHDGGQLGIETYQNTGLLIQGNHIFRNSTAGVDPGFGAGGIKAVQDTNSQIVGNEVDHNTGPGIWCDIGCSGVTIANNTVHDQAWNPIFYEISSGGEIYGNTISASNTNPFPGGNWGCIVVSSSASVNVHDNTCIDALPLRAQLEDRGDKPPGAGTGNVLQNNRLVRPIPPQATSWWQYDTSGPLVPGRNGNVDQNNVVSSSVPTATAVPLKGMLCSLVISPSGAASGTCVPS
jgi:parallel beta-helix repeat protein